MSKISDQETKRNINKAAVQHKDVRLDLVKRLVDDPEFRRGAYERMCAYELADKFLAHGQDDLDAEQMSQAANSLRLERELPIVINTGVTADERAAAYAALQTIRIRELQSPSDP